MKPLSSRAKARRASIVDAWIARFGLVCPGFRRPKHYVRHRRDLTADHVISRSAGGSEFGELRVLCRSCNSSRSRKGSSGRRDKPSKVVPHQSVLD